MTTKITNDNITSIDAGKLTGSLPAGMAPETDLSSVRSDILKLAIHQAIDGNRVAYNLENSFIDGFEDDTGITTETNVDRDTSREYISTGSTEIGAYTSDSNTLLLLHMDGSDGGTTFTDSSSHGRTVSIGGSTTTQTDQKKYGTTSADMGADLGTGDSLSVPDHADFNFEADPFTLECWTYLTSLPPNGSNGTYELFNIAQSNSTDSTGAFHFNISAGKLQCNTYRRNGSGTGDDWAFSSPSNITQNTWVHLALARQANTLRMYVDGTQVATQAISEQNSNYKLTQTDLGSDIWIGRRAYNPAYGYIFGYVDEYRVSNNCRYPDGTAFTPGTVTAYNATGTLISDTQTASSSRTSCSGVIMYEDSAGTATLGTDLKVYFTANNGTNWTEATSYGTATTYSGSKKLVKLGATTVTAGTQVAMKAVWANQAAGSKQTHLHGWAVNY